MLPLFKPISRINAIVFVYERLPFIHDIFQLRGVDKHFGVLYLARKQRLKHIFQISIRSMRLYESKAKCNDVDKRKFVASN